MIYHWPTTNSSNSKGTPFLTPPRASNKRARSSSWVAFQQTIAGRFPEGGKRGDETWNNFHHGLEKASWQVAASSDNRKQAKEHRRRYGGQRHYQLALQIRGQVQVAVLSRSPSIDFSFLFPFSLFSFFFPFSLLDDP